MLVRVANIPELLHLFTGRIFEFVHGPGVQPPVINAQNLQPIKETLLACISDEAHIAEKVCYAIGQLAAGFKEAGPTSPLSPFFHDFISALLGTVCRSTAALDGHKPCILTMYVRACCRDCWGASLQPVKQTPFIASSGYGCILSAVVHAHGGKGGAFHQPHLQALSSWQSVVISKLLMLTCIHSRPPHAAHASLHALCLMPGACCGWQAQKAGNEGEPQLQLQAFEAINEMVRSASENTLPVVQQLIPIMLQRLQGTLQGISSTSAPPPERQSDLQVCSSLLARVCQKACMAEHQLQACQCLRLSERHACLHELAWLAEQLLLLAAWPAMLDRATHHRLKCQ